MHLSNSTFQTIKGPTIILTEYTTSLCSPLPCFHKTFTLIVILPLFDSVICKTFEYQNKIPCSFKMESACPNIDIDYPDHDCGCQRRAREDVKSAIVRACSEGHSDCLEQIYSDRNQSGKEFDINFNWNEITPLIAAIRKHHTQLSRILIEKYGANVNFATKSHNSCPLGIAAEWGHLEICQILINNKVNLEQV